MKRAEQSPARGTPGPAQGSGTPLSDADVERFSRQIIIPGLGASGQARLLASSVFITGDDAASALARRYACAAGIRIVDDPAVASCCVVCVADRLTATQRARLEQASSPIVWYRLDGVELRAGVVDRVEDLAVSSSPTTPAATATDAMDGARRRALLAVAACDAISSAIGLLLAWPCAGDEHQVRLA